MSWPRNVAPEILDHLPPNDPVAVQCRRDLRLINTVTGNARTVADALAQHSPQAPRMLVDFGAGDGTFMLRVAQRLAPRWQNVTVVLLDRQGHVEDDTREAFAALKWNVEAVKADLFDYLEQMNASRGAVMTANLFVHHFERPQLERLFAHVAQSASLFVACEPLRSMIIARLSAWLWVAGCHDVTVQDAKSSVRAGFRNGELSDAWSNAWPRGDEWQLHEKTVWPFSQCFVARRRATAV